VAAERWSLLCGKSHQAEPWHCFEYVGFASESDRTTEIVRGRLSAIAAMESAPIGVVTTPGTESPKYVKAEPRPPASSLGDF
jgi:hypothetical protein